MSAIDEPMESSEEDVTRVRLPNIKEGDPAFYYLGKLKNYDF